MLADLRYFMKAERRARIEFTVAVIQRLIPTFPLLSGKKVNVFLMVAFLIASRASGFAGAQLPTGETPAPAKGDASRVGLGTVARLRNNAAPATSRNPVP